MYIFCGVIIQNPPTKYMYIFWWCIVLNPHKVYVYFFGGVLIVLNPHKVYVFVQGPSDVAGALLATAGLARAVAAELERAAGAADVVAAARGRSRPSDASVVLSEEDTFRAAGLCDRVGRAVADAAPYIRWAHEQARVVSEVRPAAVDPHPILDAVYGAAAAAVHDPEHGEHVPEGEPGARRVDVRGRREITVHTPEMESPGDLPWKASLEIVRTQGSTRTNRSSERDQSIASVPIEPSADLLRYIELLTASQRRIPEEPSLPQFPHAYPAEPTTNTVRLSRPAPYERPAVSIYRRTAHTASPPSSEEPPVSTYPRTTHTISPPSSERPMYPEHVLPRNVDHRHTSDSPDEATSPPTAAPQVTLDDLAEASIVHQSPPLRSPASLSSPRVAQAERIHTSSPSEEHDDDDDDVEGSLPEAVRRLREVRERLDAARTRASDRVGDLRTRINDVLGRTAELRDRSSAVLDRVRALRSARESLHQLFNAEQEQQPERHPSPEPPLPEHDDDDDDDDDDDNIFEENLPENNPEPQNR